MRDFLRNFGRNKFSHTYNLYKFSQIEISGIFINSVIYTYFLFYFSHTIYKFERSRDGLICG